ncbi:hypothetical protein JJ691_23240 [Kutzneria sp. CA-103260]|nr:hypothetical protein JJ691_23240 [Kutzneria sp. CA-103260]
MAGRACHATFRLLRTDVHFGVPGPRFLEVVATRNKRASDRRPRRHRDGALRPGRVTPALLVEPARCGTLLQALADPDRRFDAIVIGERERAFCGRQFDQLAPLLRAAAASSTRIDLPLELYGCGFRHAHRWLPAHCQSITNDEPTRSPRSCSRAARRATAVRPSHRGWICGKHREHGVALPEPRGQHTCRYRLGDRPSAQHRPRGLTTSRSANHTRISYETSFRGMVTHTRLPERTCPNSGCSRRRRCWRRCRGSRLRRSGPRWWRRRRRWRRPGCGRPG